MSAVTHAAEFPQHSALATLHGGALHVGELHVGATVSAQVSHRADAQAATDQGPRGACTSVHTLGAHARASGHVGDGTARLYAGTAGQDRFARARVNLCAVVTLRTLDEAAERDVPLELVLDARFFRTEAGRDPWNDRIWTAGGASVTAQARVRHLGAHEDVDALDLSLTSLARDVTRAAGTLRLPRPVAAGASATYEVRVAYVADADRGWTADVLHTGRLFLPAVPGVAWAGVGGALATQARPAWAAAADPVPLRAARRAA